MDAQDQANIKADESDDFTLEDIAQRKAEDLTQMRGPIVVNFASKTSFERVVGAEDHRTSNFKSVISEASLKRRFEPGTIRRWLDEAGIPYRKVGRLGSGCAQLTEQEFMLFMLYFG